MSGVIDKLRNMLLGTEYYDDNNEYEGYADETDQAGEEEVVTGHTRSTRDTKERAGSLDYIGARKSSKNNNVINFNNNQSENQHQVVITSPADVQDATLICEHIKDQKACVVNLEGVERASAQRIADFLGGAAFALNGEIERISNEIFIIAPATFHVTADLKEELKASGHVLSWASSFK